ncbi:MAG: ribbon-helix-helix protein, CopG family [Deltaproteobacteria bacterium]|nr:ribbon-helix-helix protein, CopG family [Deltaproteobacteria bacterium]
MAAALAHTRKRINIELPGIIVDKLDKLARKVEFSRSELTRRLISESLDQKERGEMELAMKEGHEANYGFIKESNKEWDFTSGDGISLPPAFGFRLNPD